MPVNAGRGAAGARRQISTIAPRFGPETLVVSLPLLCVASGGFLVFRTNPLVARLLPRLLYQLVPAALVTTVGVLLLSSLTKVPDMAPIAPVETAITAEAVFKIVPREVAEPDAKQDGKRAAASRSASPKPAAVNVPTPPRKPADESRQAANVPAPLPIAPEPQPASDNSLMGKLRSTGTAVARMPLQAAQRVTGWFAAEAPPRPPAPVPAQNFQTAM